MCLFITSQTTLATSIKPHIRMDFLMQQIYP